ncbi:hypothetical protein NKR23_g11362 [Pleurostoma richardsiae]|uniref:Transmembrane protein n=1 Tax=Pleurostoma richardsiae TaxID=41990 RepID=A0AA38VDK9_9PEZI|nr:hypothetical protein NKR23_g11362 [Pleurostoma richardsiae]
MAGQESAVGCWQKWSVFQGLTVTTGVSIVLIVVTARNLTIGGDLYEYITQNRATTQLAVQLVSSLLGLIHVSVLCRLINHGARLHLAKHCSVRVRTLCAWAALCTPRMELDVPIPYLLPLLAASVFGIISSSLWTGALTPVVSSVLVQQPLSVPSYRNTTLIKEYPSEISGTGPTVTTRQGLFTYSVGIKHLGALIASAASATTADGSVRKHAKIDNTQFAYEGRSFGVGSPAGLTDTNITDLSLATDYRYSEPGYQAHVACMYNTSSDFAINQQVDSRIWEVGGELPDSIGGGESSEYVGHSSDVIVAMGVAFSGDSPRRFVAIAAGDSYAQLNQMQCAIDFTPTLFNVTVAISSRNISVTPVQNIDDFDPDRNMTRTLMRQFELITNDMTNIYVSIVGDALMSSVSAVQASNDTNSTTLGALATLVGVQNALTAMTDDMLASYASAQLMVGNLSDVVLGDVTMSALMIGQLSYIVAISVINIAIVLVFLAEVMRTRGWRMLPALDIADPKWLITASFRGGSLSQQTGGSWSEGSKLIQTTESLSEKEREFTDSIVQLRRVSADGEDVALFLSDSREVR